MHIEPQSELRPKLGKWNLVWRIPKFLLPRIQFITYCNTSEKQHAYVQVYMNKHRKPSTPREERINHRRFLLTPVLAGTGWIRSSELLEVQ